ncbi:hypothetical protein [Streptomyces nigra]|uniref:hypothetical protein n=1 Tax=Streptomyces nigra TaxID=1827580 RepID=UPI00369BF69B
MVATTDDNVWVTGVLVLIVPVALVLLPPAPAPVGILPACLREQLDHDPEAARVPSWASVE